ncbi:MAG: BlaI/MecI/CopY family transcriptional regulator [Catalinimonas sp.]
MKNQPNRPTEAELEILQLLWQQHPQTVREVNDRLNRRKETGYTTTLKILQIMLEKGFVRRTAEGRTHHYSPVLKEDETQRALLDRFLDTAFRGSAMKMVTQLLGHRRATPQELDQVRDLLNKMEGDDA